MQDPLEIRAAQMREDYLSEVSRRIQGRLDALDAHESLSEMRNHLNDMAVAYQELGMDAESSMRAAITKFGSAQEISADLAETGSPANQWMPLAILGHFIVTPALAYLLMLMLDMVFHYVFRVTATIDTAADLVVGGASGLLVAALSWFHKSTPALFAGKCVAAFNALILLIMGRSFLDLGQPLFVIGFLTSISLCVFVTAYTAARTRELLVTRQRARQGLGRT